MNKTFLVFTLVLLILTLQLANSEYVNLVSANPGGSFPNLAMPIESVNYTITPVNGSLWAKIDGDYPIYILKQLDCSFNGDLPMVYPMPPGAINIHVYLDNQELNWINYTQAYPDELHHTAIGDWSMIYCVLNNVSDNFVLKIHYEHPLQTVNESYIFLYDLNISPYLSTESNNSTVYYTIRMETNTTNLHAFTTITDTEWNPIDYTSKKEGSTQVISINEHSEYNKPLPGDLVVEFSGADQIPEFPIWTVPAVILTLFIIVWIALKRKNIF